MQQAPTEQAQPSNNISAEEEKNGEGGEGLALFNTAQAVRAVALLVLLLCATTADYCFGARARHQLGQTALPL